MVFKIKNRKGLIFIWMLLINSEYTLWNNTLKSSADSWIGNKASINSETGLNEDLLKTMPRVHFNISFNKSGKHLDKPGNTWKKSGNGFLKAWTKTANVTLETKMGSGVWKTSVTLYVICSDLLLYSLLIVTIKL